MGVLINPISRRIGCKYQFWVNNVSHYYKRYYPIEFNNLTVYLKFTFKKFFRRISRKANKYRELFRFKSALFFNLVGFGSESAVITLIFFINDVFGFSFGTIFWRLREIFKRLSRRFYFSYIRSSFFRKKKLDYHLNYDTSDHLFWRKRKKDEIFKSFVEKFKRTFKNKKERILLNHFKKIFSSNSKSKFVDLAIKKLIKKIRRNVKFISLMNELFSGFSANQILMLYNRPFNKHSFSKLLKLMGGTVFNEEGIKFNILKNRKRSKFYGVFAPFKFRRRYDIFKFRSGRFFFVNRLKFIFLERFLGYFEKIRNERFKGLKVSLLKNFSIMADKIISKSGFSYKNLIINFRLESVLGNFGVFSYAQTLAQWIRFKFICGFRINKILKEFKKFIKVLNFKNKSFLGYKICLSGRFTRARIATYRYVYCGQVPFTTTNSKFDYGFCTWIAQFGICGIKIWLHYGLVRNLAKGRRRRIFRKSIVPKPKHEFFNT